MLRRSTVAAAFLCTRFSQLQSFPISAFTRAESLKPTNPSGPSILPSRSTICSSSTFSKTSLMDSSTSDTDEPRTGWTHNQPKKWSNDDAEKNDTSAKTKETKELRTGWLHNTESPQSEKKSNDLYQLKETLAQRLLRLEKRKKRIHHRMIHAPTFHACSGGAPMVVTEHKIAIPLNHNDDGDDNEEGDTVDVYFTISEKIKNDEQEEFFRSLQQIQSDTQRASDYVQHASLQDASKMILYLQGGPGFGSPTPVVGLGLEGAGSWAAQALNKEGFERVVLMDQRGTGRSTPITKQTLEKKFPDMFVLDEKEKREVENAPYNEFQYSLIDNTLQQWKQAEPESYTKLSSSLDKAVDYLSCFRADSIVKDAEKIKDALLLPLEPDNDASDETPRPWGAALGQSFGGFCMMSYLSLIPNPPKICLLTGGIAPMLTSPLEAYHSLWERVKERNQLYYDMYPCDIQLVHTIVSSLLDNPVPLPSGGLLTARRFLQLGISLGGSPSAFASLHSLFNTAILDDDGDNVEFSRAFLKHMDSCQPFDDHPIYFLMHESIYGDGDRFGPTEWAAHRALEERTQTPDDFSYKLTSKMKSDSRPTFFTGEMVFPWMADGDFAEVSGLGMKALAHILARKKDWTPLYDENAMKAALAPGGVSRAAAAAYFDDMYVDFDACMKVSKSRDAPLGNCKLYITNEYQHSGLRDNGAAIFSKILGMAKGTVRTPS